MLETIRKSRSVYGKYFYGNEVSAYGQEKGFVDYRTLAKSFDAVLNNDIMRELENAGFYFDTVQDGSSDFSDEINELREAADELREAAEEYQEQADEANDAADEISEEAEEETDAARAVILQKRIRELRTEAKKAEADAKRAEEEADKKDEEADDLESQQEPSEIYQYFIIDAAGAQIIQEWTDDPLFYCEALDMYIWGVTHWGTSWDYVLTDIRINAGEEALS